MRKKLLILYHKSIEEFRLLEDLKTDQRVILKCVDYKSLNKWQSFFYRLHNNRIAQKLHLPFTDYWFNSWDIDRLFDEISHIFIFNGGLCYAPIEKLKKFQMGGGKICLYLIDSYDASSPVMCGVKKRMAKVKFDKVFTFDECDSKKYGFELLQHCYYSKLNVAESSPERYSAYFVGGVKGERTDIIEATYRRLMKSDSERKPLYKVFTYGKQTIMDANGIQYVERRIPYEQVLKDIQQSSAIIELLQKNQYGPSLRYYEAVVYNKKLITTNKLIVNYPYYDKRWMKVIQAAEEIDIEWLNNNEEVNYGYKGDFSPIHLVDRILVI